MRPTIRDEATLPHMPQLRGNPVMDLTRYALISLFPIRFIRGGLWIRIRWWFLSRTGVRFPSRRRLLGLGWGRLRSLAWGLLRGLVGRGVRFLSLCWGWTWSIRLRWLLGRGRLLRLSRGLVD